MKGPCQETQNGVEQESVNRREERFAKVEAERVSPG
jgi:hypothetical protein